METETKQAYTHTTLSEQVRRPPTPPLFSLLLLLLRSSIAIEDEGGGSACFAATAANTARVSGHFALFVTAGGFIGDHLPGVCCALATELHEATSPAIPRSLIEIGAMLACLLRRNGCSRRQT